MQIILISIISIVSILIIMYKYNNIILQSVMNCVIVGYILALLGIRYGLVVLYLSNTRSLYGLINCINHSIRIILIVLICIVTSPTSTTPFGFIFTYSPSEITSTSPATIVFIFNNKCYNIINISSSSYFILYLNYIKRIIYYLYVLHVMITSKLLVILIRIYYRLNNMYIYINNISITIYNNISIHQHYLLGLVLCIAIGYSIIYNIVKILVIRYSIIISMTNILGIRLTLPRYTIILGLYSTLIIRYIIYSISKLNIRYIIILICMKIRYRIIINSKMISHPVSIYMHCNIYYKISK